MSAGKPQSQLPYDRGAEEATIAALLIDPDAMERVRATGLQPGDFYLMRLRLIFRAMMELQEKNLPADYILVLSQLEQNGHLKSVGGPAAVTALIDRCPTSIYATHYADLVVRDGLRRRAIARAGEAAKVAYASNGSAEELRQQLRALLEDVDRDTNTPTVRGVLR